jgi:hypothetical protein
MRPKLLKLILGCYPQWWRDRYADEVRAVVSDLQHDGRRPTGVALSLLVGAVRTRIRPVGMPQVHDLWVTRTKVSIAVATLSWFVVAPIALFSAAGGENVVSLRGSVFPSVVPMLRNPQFMIYTHQAHFPGGHPPHPLVAPALSQSGHVIGHALFAFGIASAAGLIALALGWLQLLLGIRASSTIHRRFMLFLAWTPAIAVLSYVGLWFAYASQLPSHWIGHGNGPAIPLNGNPTAAHALHLALIVVALSGWIGSVVCIAIAVKRSDLALIDLRFGKRLAMFMAPVVSVMFVAYVVMGIALYMQPPPSFSGLTVVSDHQALLVPIMVALGCSSVVTILAAGSARRSWRVIASPI